MSIKSERNSAQKTTYSIVRAKQNSRSGVTELRDCNKEKFSWRKLFMYIRRKGFRPAWWSQTVRRGLGRLYKTHLGHKCQYLIIRAEARTISCPGMLWVKQPLTVCEAKLRNPSTFSNPLGKKLQGLVGPENLYLMSKTKQRSRANLPKVVCPKGVACKAALCWRSFASSSFRTAAGYEPVTKRSFAGRRVGPTRTRCLSLSDLRASTVIY